MSEEWLTISQAYSACCMEDSSPQSLPSSVDKWNKTKRNCASAILGPIRAFIHFQTFYFYGQITGHWSLLVV